MRVPAIYWIRLTWIAVAVAVLAIPLGLLVPQTSPWVTCSALGLSLLGLWGARRVQPHRIPDDPHIRRTLRLAVVTAVFVLVVSAVIGFIR